MNRLDFERAMGFVFTHPIMKRRMDNSIRALRRRNMDPETRGVVLGHLEIIDYFRDKLANDIWTDTGEVREFPSAVPDSPLSTPEAERVAPLPRKVGWDTR